jgi:hypothetical protein
MKKPLAIDLTLDNAEEAIRYWLSNVVFRDSVDIDTVAWLGQERSFHITFKKPPTTP